MSFVSILNKFIAKQQTAMSYGHVKDMKYWCNRFHKWLGGDRYDKVDNARIMTYLETLNIGSRKKTINALRKFYDFVIENHLGDIEESPLKDIEVGNSLRYNVPQVTISEEEFRDIINKNPGTDIDSLKRKVIAELIWSGLPVSKIRNIQRSNVHIKRIYGVLLTKEAKKAMDAYLIELDKLPLPCGLPPCTLEMGMPYNKRRKCPYKDYIFSRIAVSSIKSMIKEMGNIANIGYTLTPQIIAKSGREKYFCNTK